MATNETANSTDKFDEWASRCVEKGIALSSSPSVLKGAKDAAEDHFGSLLDKLDDDTASATTTKKIPTYFAELIAKLGPALSMQAASTKFSARALALNYMLGALLTMDKRGAPLPFEMMKLVSAFLLEHCGPMQPPSGEFFSGNSSMVQSDQDLSSDDVRDSALKCINTLLRISFDDTADGKTSDDSKISIDKCISFRIDVAQKGIRKRCTNLEDCEDSDLDEDSGDEMNDNERGPDQGEAKILSNLSLLPRSKRSLCFEALESAAISMEKDAQMLMGGVCTCTNLIVNFASFAAACLHGETDPRCLVQMLNLMNVIQTSLAPIVESFSGAGHGCDKSFPYVDIFDSVAVYYPVRFTPPRNDPHGITREGINSSLMKVLTCSSRFIRGENSIYGGDASMTALAAGLFLERISPPRPSDAYSEEDEQDVSTVQDRIEAVRDLEDLLLLALDDNGKRDEKEQQTILSNLTPDLIREMSSVLSRCHEEAAATVATGKKEDEVEENKALADIVRHFVTRISYEFERLQISCTAQSSSSLWNSFMKTFNGAGSPWEIFVKDQVGKLANTISSSPQSLKGRVAIAYLASLSACGGEKTLRLCVDACIPRMAELLDNNIKTVEDNRDNEKTATVVYGISVLFSSCQLSMEQIMKDGINIHPHPLLPYGSRIVRMLCDIINENIITNEYDQIKGLEIAAMKALDSVLLSSPAAILNTSDTKDTDSVRETILSLAKMLVSNIFSTSNVDADFKFACARIVGSTIGKSMKGRNATSNQQGISLLECDHDIASFVDKILFPKMIESSTTATNADDSERYDWIVLGYACETDQLYTTQRIVAALHRSLVQSINEASKSGITVQAETIARAISHILKSGGPNIPRVFHTMSYDGENGNDLIQSLTTKRTEENESEQMSLLLLPGTQDQYRSEADMAVKLSHSILPYILPIYGKEFPITKIENLILRAAQVIPPLSDWDGAELCTILPVLSVALAGDKTPRHEALESLLRIAPDLCDYAFSCEANGSSRRAAASCLFSIIGKYQVDNTECVGLRILRNQICPIIVNAIEDRSEHSSYENMEALKEAMGLMALIASAASRRGRGSVPTVVEVMKFLVLISCESAASAPNLGINSPLDCSGDSLGIDQYEVSSIAAASLGSVLSVKDANPFGKQRLALLLIPIVLSCNHSPIADLNGAELGRLICASNIICNINEKAIGQQNLENLMAIIVGGFEKAVKILCTGQVSTIRPTILQDLISLLLASLLKAHYQYSSIMVPHLGSIVPALLLTTTIYKAVPTSTLNLMSMQMLVDLTYSLDAGAIHLCKTYKTKVMEHLASSLDHPSSQVRQAAVLARNIWGMVE